MLWRKQERGIPTFITVLTKIMKVREAFLRQNRAFGITGGYDAFCLALRLLGCTSQATPMLST